MVSQAKNYKGITGKDKKVTMVAVRDIRATSIEKAVSEIIEAFPEARRKISKSNNIFIKVNAVYFHPFLYTSPELITAVVNYARSIDPGKKIFIMDNCSQGNFTRLCFHATGLDKLAKIIGAKALYLDEQKPVKINFKPGMQESYNFPAILKQHLIDERENSCYINLPVLKSHCQAQMTCGLKNQMGLVYAEDRARRHNHLLHQHIVDIYSYIKPDITIVDAQKVLESGPMPAGRYVDSLLHDRNLIFGGPDTVAVDAVAATVLGYSSDEVRHLALAGDEGLGVAVLDQIAIDGEMPVFEDRVPWEFQTHFPTSITFVKGIDGVCTEGCLGHAEQVLELVVNDGSSPEMLEGRYLTFVTGKKFSDEQLGQMQEPIVVLGKCACRDALPRIKNIYSEVEVLDTCGRCDNILNIALKRLKVNPVNMTPVSLPRLLVLWLAGKAHGLKYNLPL
jgi:uncharacterized protein (DUF362 family)